MVPAPTNSTSSSGNSSAIAGAVVRWCARQLPGFAYWFSHTYRSSDAHSAWTWFNRAPRKPPTGSGSTTACT